MKFNVRVPATHGGLDTTSSHSGRWEGKEHEKDMAEPTLLEFTSTVTNALLRKSP